MNKVFTLSDFENIVSKQAKIAGVKESKYKALYQLIKDAKKGALLVVPESIGFADTVTAEVNINRIIWRLSAKANPSLKGFAFDVMAAKSKADEKMYLLVTVTTVPKDANVDVNPKKVAEATTLTVITPTEVEAPIEELQEQA